MAGPASRRPCRAHLCLKKDRRFRYERMGARGILGHDPGDPLIKNIFFDMNSSQRTVLTRLLTGYTLLFFVLRFFEYVTPSRLQGPPLFTTGLDLTYWAYRLLHLQQFLMMNHSGAVTFDLGIVLFGGLVLLFPLQRKWIIGFSILIALYAI